MNVIAGEAVSNSAGKLLATLRVGAWLPAAILFGGSLAAIGVPHPARLGLQNVEPTFAGFWQAVVGLDTATWVALLILVVLTTVVIQPLQSGLLALVTRQARESTLPTLAKLMQRRHRWIHDRLRRKVLGPTADEQDRGERGASLRSVAIADRRLLRYPHERAEIRPTLLGNVLARSELSVGSDFGFDYQILGPALLETLGGDVRDPTERPRAEIEVYAGLAFASAIVGFVSVWSAWGADAKFWGVSIGWFVASCGIYRGAVRAGDDYRSAVALTGGLYRFRLLRAMRLPLPNGLADEIGAFGMAAELLDETVSTLSVVYVDESEPANPESEARSPMSLDDSADGND